MKSIDSGKEKVKKICEILRKETLEPAKQEGARIVAKAQADAKRMLEEAKHEALKIVAEARKKIEEERNVFQASIHLASKKALDTLKQRIEERFFHPELSRLIHETVKNPKIVAQMIAAMIAGVEKEGINGDLKAIVASVIDVEAINRELTKKILERLKSSSVEIGEIEGGAQLKIVDENLIIDFSEKALKNFLANFVREDFRSLIFAAAL